MHVAVTIQHDKDMEELRVLIGAIRQLLSSEQVTIFEAPESLDYPYPMPVVTITADNAARSRLFGQDAIEKLRDLAKSAR